MSIVLSNLWNSVGKRTDDAVTAVGTTSSLMSYIKGLANRFSGVTEPKAVTVELRYSDTSYKTILSASDVGVLTGVIITHATLNTNLTFWLEVTIDGTKFLDGLVGFIGNSVTSCCSFPFNHRFDSSILVRAKFGEGGGSGYGHVTVTYTTD